MDADLVTLGDDPALLLGVQQCRHRRHIKARLDPVLFEHLQNARHADPVAVLAPGEPPDRFPAVAQIGSLVVAVERQRHRAARAPRPFGGPQGPPGAHPVDQPAPMLLRPLPRFQR